MEELLNLLNRLYLSNLQLYGVNHRTEVMLSMGEIKNLLGYERLSAEKFCSDFSDTFGNFGVSMEIVNYSDFIKFNLSSMRLTSVEMIRKYDSIISELRAEAELTGDFYKIGVNI